MQLTPLASHVIPVTSSVPNHHTHTRIRVTNACRDQGSPIATRIPPNTGFAKTRHTTLTWVERRFGFAVAHAYASHQDASRGARAMATTGTYVRAGLPEVATALTVLTGEQHPLAPEGPSADVSTSPGQ
jgi:hypothetical protein